LGKGKLNFAFETGENLFVRQVYPFIRHLFIFIASGCKYGHKLSENGKGRGTHGLE